jgi:adenylate kinase family enzyme
MKRHEHLKLFLERVKALFASPRLDDELKTARKLMPKYKKTRHLHKFTYKGNRMYLSILESGDIFQVFGEMSKSGTHELALLLDDDCGVTFTEHLLRRYKERTG